MTTQSRHFRFPWRSCPWAWHENSCSLAHLCGCLSPLHPLLHQDIHCSACSPVPSTGQMWSLCSGSCLHSCGRDVLPQGLAQSSANMPLKPDGREGNSANERGSAPQAILQCTASYRWPSNSQDSYSEGGRFGPQTLCRGSNSTHQRWGCNKWYLLQSGAYILLLNKFNKGESLP